MSLVDPNPMVISDDAIRDFTARQLWSMRRANRRVNFWEGSVRSGKTIGSFVPWIDHVREAPRGVLFMIGKTMETLERNVLLPLEDMYGKDAIEYNLYRGKGAIFGRPIDLVSAYDETSFKRIRGSTVAGWYGDELTLWPETFFAELLHRMSPPGSKGFGTTNPDSPFHYLKKNYLNRIALLQWNDFQFKLHHNTFLSEEFVEALKRENVGLWYKRFILGLWVLAAGTVYDMFDEDRHIEEPPGYFPRFGCAVDYGTANATAFGIFGYGRGDGRVHLVDLYYYDPETTGRSKTDAQFVQDFLEFTRGYELGETIVDPSAKSFIVALEDAGVPVTWAINDVKDGIRFVSSLLQERKFLVSNAKSCRPAVDEFGSYVWSENAQKKGRDEPVKQFDHALDMIRYFLFTKFYNAYSTEGFAIVT